MGPVKKLERASVMVKEAMDELEDNLTAPREVAVAMGHLADIAEAIDVEFTITPWEIIGQRNGHHNGEAATV